MSTGICGTNPMSLAPCGQYETHCALLTGEEEVFDV
jgi:hypothetical protein